MSNFRLIFMSLPLVNAQSVGVLEEVVVTAQKTEENLQDAPFAITAITESTIDDLDLANVVDLAGMAPNVHIINTPSNNTAATIAMRGGVTINPAITWEPTVGMYLDGVYLGKGQGSIFDVVDLDGDGVVSDEELAHIEKIEQLETFFNKFCMYFKKWSHDMESF